VSLLTAILTAMAFAIFGFPFRYYQCWLSWSRLSANLGIATYLLMAGAGGGFIGGSAATATEAQLGSNDAVRGIFYGIAGTLAVRADFRTRPVAGRQVKDAASLLGKGITWTTSALDDTTRLKARNWLYQLDAASLAGAARDITNEIESIPPQHMSATSKKTLLVRLNQALNEMRDEQSHDDGHARMVHFCAEYYVAQHTAKPVIHASQRS